ncbi:hypothetical protein [Leeia sp.]|uniref:hypothetical protein n=1 Tax=Leeia sp. TaxID=2884678 RepID=UPI0035B4C1A6
MPVALSFEELKDFLSKQPVPCLVALEGFMEAGKSTVTEALGELLGYKVFHTDNLLDTARSGSYRNRVDVVQLRKLLEVVNGRALIEGICLRWVLADAGITPDCYLYVKRIQKQGNRWDDGQDLEDFEAGEDVYVRNALSNTRGVAKLMLPGGCDPDERQIQEAEAFYIETLRYHRDCKPHERADFIFERIEGP